MASRLEIRPELNSFCSAAARLKRRRRASCIEAKSSGPSTVRILKRRYCSLAGLPSMKTTIEATLSVPWVLEMS